MHLLPRRWSGIGISTSRFHSRPHASRTNRVVPSRPAIRQSPHFRNRMIDTTVRAAPCRRQTSAHVSTRTVCTQPIFDDIRNFGGGAQAAAVHTTDETRQHPIAEIRSSLHPSIYRAMPTDRPSDLPGRPPSPRIFFGPTGRMESGVGFWEKRCNARTCRHLWVRSRRG